MKSHPAIVLLALILAACSESVETKNVTVKPLNGYSISTDSRSVIPVIDNGASPFSEDIRAEHSEVFVKGYLNALESKSVRTLLKYHEPKPIGVPVFGPDLREIIPGFEERIMYAEKIIPNPDNPNVQSIRMFRIRLLTHKDVIIYYDFSEEKNKKVNDEWKPYYELIQSYQNKTEINALKLQFQASFHTRLNDRELFIKDFVYGSHCGATGENPEGRNMVDTLVKRKDKASLVKCLQSTNAEMQLYGFDGLTQLQKSGVVISEREQKMMNIVATKKGQVNTCSGCSYMNSSIQEEIRQIKSRK